MIAQQSKVLESTAVTSEQETILLLKHSAVTPDLIEEAAEYCGGDLDSAYNWAITNCGGWPKDQVLSLRLLCYKMKHRIDGL